MKWIKLLKDYDNRKVSEVYQEQDAVADILTKTKTAEPAEEPKAVADAADPTAQIDVKAVAQELVADLRNEFLAATKAITNKGKRPVGTIETHDNELDDPKFGYKHFGEQLLAVKRFCNREGEDPRMKIAEAAIKQKAPTNYANEGSGPDGGFAVAPDFHTELLSYLYADDNILARCRKMTTGGNVVTIPTDETVAWGTDGVQAYWAGESSTLTTSKPKLGQMQIQLHKLTALVPVTNELLEDNAFSLASYVGANAPIKIADKINGSLVGGTGAGQPLGILNSPAIVSTATTGGSAGHFNATNAAKMFANMPAYMRNNSVWMYHSTVLPEIMTMSIGQVPVFFPPGGIGASPGGALWGRPLIQSEQLQALGTLGDIWLVDWNQYIAVTKANGLRQDMSIHLYFDSDITAFRFIFRIGGRPWMKAPITQKNGGGTLSGFVNLVAR